MKAPEPCVGESDKQFPDRALHGTEEPGLGREEDGFQDTGPMNTADTLPETHEYKLLESQACGQETQLSMS